ncbi:MAG: M56 family metallopeptidase [Pseudomonadota bacterium]
MTAVKPVLDTYLELNLVIFLALIVWLVVRWGLERTSFRMAFFAQLRVLKILLLCIVLSPLLAAGFVAVLGVVSPDRPVAIGDIAVAAYLRGDIAMPATQLEHLLQTRERWVDALLNGGSVFAFVLLAGLLAGAVLLSLRIAQAALCIQATIATSILWRQSNKVDIRFSDHISVPFAVRGLRRRHVVLPSHLVAQPRDLRFALAHEFQHIRAGDIEWELAMEFLRPLFFWNPAFLILKYQFERLRELGCDQSIVARGHLNSADYAKCLLDYCAQTVSRKNAKVLNVALVGGGRAKHVLKQRMIALTETPSCGHPTQLLVFGIAMVLAVTLAIGSASMRQTSDWTHDRLMLSTVVNLERLAERNRGN